MEVFVVSFYQHSTLLVCCGWFQFNNYTQILKLPHFSKNHLFSGDFLPRPPQASPAYVLSLKMPRLWAGLLQYLRECPLILNTHKCTHKPRFCYTLAILDHYQCSLIQIRASLNQSKTGASCQIFSLLPVETFLSPASGGWRRPTGGTASSESPTSPATASPSPPAAQAPPCWFARM